MASSFGVDVAGLSIEASPDTVPAWTSLSHLQLVLALESEFNVTFSDNDVTDMLSARLIVMVLEEHGVTSV